MKKIYVEKYGKPGPKIKNFNPQHIYAAHVMEAGTILIDGVDRQYSIIMLIDKNREEDES